MPNLFDNLSDDTRLAPALQSSFEDYDRLDVATGYLDLRGWDSFAGLVDSKAPDASGEPCARVLVGMVAPSDSQQLLDSLQAEVQRPAYGSDIPDLERARERRDHLVAHLRLQLMRGLATRQGQRTLQSLKAQLQDGRVQMKVFTSKPLHGKTYIFHAHGKRHAARWGYVGSSNLTGAGLHNNLELNLDVQDSDATAKLAAWFEDRWDDPFSLEITAEILELISESWADEQQPTPYEIYLKVCHSLAQDARDGMGYVLPGSMHNLLLEYQESAVRTLSRRIVRRGGTMLGDVVGLGKTLTAVGTALMLQAAEDYSTLVLCPKNLEPMWQEHLDRFDVTGRVVPYSMAPKRLPELKRFHLVICDESHNLRNSNTQAYEAIHQYIRNNGSKVLLLTATPYNLAFEDVANQIALYLDEDDDLGIVPSAALAADPRRFQDLVGKHNTLAAFRRSEDPDDWKRLMSDHLIRRTRSFIKKTARRELRTLADGTEAMREYVQFAGGGKFFFPERIAKPISHDFSADDPARLMEDDDTLNAVQNLILPRYRLADYDDPKRPHTDEDRKKIDDIRAGRGNVSGFVRVGLFKRLSSSGHSFILTLQRQLARNELLAYAIDNALPFPLGTFTDRQLGADEDQEADSPRIGTVESRYADLQRTLPSSAQWISTTIFKATLRADLQRDNDAIMRMLTRFGAWEASRDSKLQALVKLLTDEHPGEKVLVFSEYADTAEYVAAALEQAGIPRVGLATGGSENPAALARRFSPVSSRLPGDPDDAAEPQDPIDVLVATDVLSEGQNLQDAHIIVNYDLPWAIIRIIQRAGRVDRVGQTSDVVYIYLISHDTVERQIRLRQRIRDRLQAAASAFGSDERFFGSDEEVNLLNDFYDGKLSDDEAEGEADAVSEAALVWHNANEQHPEITARVLALQDMVHSTRAQRTRERGGGVACYVRTAAGIDAFAFADGPERGRLLTPFEALRAFEAEPETPTAELRADHFDLERTLVHDTLRAETIAEGNLRGIRKWAWNKLGGTIYAADAGEGLDALHERALTEHATARLGQARRNRWADADIADLIRQLHDDGRLVIGGGDTDTIAIVCSLGIQNA